ncbi:MAG: hypothetical protein QOJ97_2455 [Solirubrobacteraceae bacterium]|jgi:hypothetical protein|nr:hypothetical protein [Solirubrobacteraceae bacterium]
MASKYIFPRRTLEQALRVPTALRDKNGGQPWPPDQVAAALGVGKSTTNFFYITAASRDYGLTAGTREAAEISLTDLGRRAVFPQSDAEERTAKLEGFLRVDVFRKVLEHFGGNKLPERKFLDNTLTQTYGVEPSTIDEFIDIFSKNCRYLGIGAEFRPGPAATSSTGPAPAVFDGGGTVTVDAPEGAEDAPVCFVIMPFTEREDEHQTGFFEEVLKQIFTPAARDAGFKVTTALRPGSDLIHSTIVNDLLAADLVLADLTEHNPNVLFELGMRMHADKPVALVRAIGTGPIFDVDNLLRVEEYNPNVWPSSVERDVPKLSAHIGGTWENRETGTTFMGLLHPPS